MKVRRATRNDLDRMVEMGRHFFESSPFAHLGAFDAGSTRYAFLHGFEGIDNYAAFFVAEDEKSDGMLIGMCAVALVPFYFAPSITVAREEFWWVEPAARATGAGLALLEKAADWASGKNATLLSFAHFVKEGAATPGVVFNEMGFDPLEIAYAKRIA